VTGEPTASELVSPRQRIPWWAPAVVAVVVLRARFVVTPLTSDEGGYLAIGRAWGRGAVLYQDVWIDRPQGLLALFRLLDVVGLGSPEGVRVLAILAAVVATVACGQIAGSLAGPQARWVTALVVGVLVSVPQIEGYIANGELIAGAFSTSALAVVLRASWDRDVPSLRLIALAGAIAGSGVMVKQNAIEGLVTGAVILAGLVMTPRWPARYRRWALPAFVLGAAVPVSVAALHGLVTGWDPWLEAVIGYRLSNRSAVSNADWERLVDTGLVAAPALAPALLLVVVGGAVAVRSGRLRAPVIGVLGTWSVLAVFDFVSGGQFFRHYWIMLVFPLATSAGVALSTLPSVRWRRFALAGVLAIPLVLTAVAVTHDRTEIGERLHDDWRLAVDEDVASWFDQHARPGDTIYAQCAAAGLYGNLEIDPPLPYLWFDTVRLYPGAREALHSLMASPDRPRFVVAYQQADSCDPSGRLLELVLDGYQHVHTIGGLRIYERRS
jgi:hypothetical protein